MVQCGRLFRFIQIDKDVVFIFPSQIGCKPMQQQSFGQRNDGRIKSIDEPILLPGILRPDHQLILSSLLGASFTRLSLLPSARNRSHNVYTKRQIMTLLKEKYHFVSASMCLPFNAVSLLYGKRIKFSRLLIKDCETARMKRERERFWTHFFELLIICLFGKRFAGIRSDSLTANLKAFSGESGLWSLLLKHVITYMLEYTWRIPYTAVSLEG